ncbi:increased DNA methylation 3-like [Euphorbia lathyris]|uniref:increased DNA methylation 3-like n=1 Tax=Euphorbia lathyris TaxID=212925 RepID=UPI003313D114
MANDDQHFLLYFITGIYFGPDLKNQKIHKSIFRREAEGLPEYTSDQLAGSSMRMKQVQLVYDSVLRNADKSLSMKLSLLHQFFHGTMVTLGDQPPAEYRQFPDLFPPQLHPQLEDERNCKMIHNIVVINDPDISYVNADMLERFKRLTGLQLDDKLPAPALGTSRKKSNTRIRRAGKQPALEQPGSHEVKRRFQSQNVQIVSPFRSIPAIGTTQERESTVFHSGTAEMVGPPTFLMRASSPRKEDWDNIRTFDKNVLFLTGSAATGQMGPSIAHVNICESDDSYFFRVAMPGVKNGENFLSCVVDNVGTVNIKGVTTKGEEFVELYSRRFIMLSKNLGPPGEFSLAFNLPGRVDARHFRVTFSNGMLEGVVHKSKNYFFDNFTNGMLEGIVLKPKNILSIISQMEC